MGERDVTRVVSQVKQVLLNPLFWLVVGIILYVCSYWQESGYAIQAQRTNLYRCQTPSLSPINAPLEIHILYPHTLPWNTSLNTITETSRTVSITLLYTTTPEAIEPYTVTLAIPTRSVAASTAIGDWSASQTSKCSTLTTVITPQVKAPTSVAVGLYQLPVADGDSRIDIELSLFSPHKKEIAILHDEPFSIFLERPASRWSKFWALVLDPTASLIAGAVALFMWAIKEIFEREKREQEDRKREQEDRKRALLDDLESARTLATTNPPEAFQLYLECSRRAAELGNDAQIERALRRVWEKSAPEPHNAARLLEVVSDESQFEELFGEIGVKEGAQALAWAIKNLDDEWGAKAVTSMLRMRGRITTSPVWTAIPAGKKDQGIIRKVLQGDTRRLWEAHLRPWTHVSLWQQHTPIYDPDIAWGARILGVDHYPLYLGAPRAEEDTRLFETHVQPPWLASILEQSEPKSTLLVGELGSGKTATALLLAYYWLERWATFPVYYPVTMMLNIFDLAGAVSRTLLFHLAVNPTGFLNRGRDYKEGMAHLLRQYHLPSQLRQAGLSEKVIREIDAHISPEREFSQSTISDHELLTTLSVARPRGFEYTTILIDIQNQVLAGHTNTDDLSKYVGLTLELCEALKSVRIPVFVFFPERFQGALDEIEQWQGDEVKRLQWSPGSHTETGDNQPEDNLYDLLERRVGEHSNLNNLCDPGVKDVTERLVEKADGNPGKLISTANALLRKAGQKRGKLTAEDVDAILSET